MEPDRILRVLIVEDSLTDAELVARALRNDGGAIEVERVDSADALRVALERASCDVVISDYSLPGFSGPEALQIVKSHNADIPFILVSGTVGEEIAVHILKSGADDYVLKGNLTRLAAAVRSQLVEAEERRSRRRSEQALRRAQAMARLGHVITLDDGRFESWSETLPAVLGLDAKKMPQSARQWLELLHPEDRAPFREKMREAGSGARVDVEYRLRREDGKWMHVRQVIEPLEDVPNVGSLTRWFSTLQDVTEQKQVEELLRGMTRDLSAEKRLLQNLMDSVPDAIFFKDRQHRFLRINRVHAGILGVSRPEDAVGRPTTDFFPPDEARQRELEDQKVMDSGAPLADTVRRISLPGGKARWSSTMKAPIKDEAGQVIGLVGIARDITERQRLLEELRDREAGLSRAQQLARLAHVISAPDGSFEGWAETLPQLLGIAAEAVPRSTREWLVLVHADEREKFRAKSIAAARSGERVDLEYRLRRADGAWINVRQVLDPMPGEADRQGRRRWFSTLQDVTQEKRAGEELRASEGLKGAILEASLDCIITMDHEGKIVEFNPAAELTFGYGRHQAVGKLVAELIIPAGLRDAHHRGLAHYLATGKGPVLGKRLELSAIRADGSEFPIELAITPIKVDSRTLFTGFIRDITERRESEAKIRRLNRVYAILSGINTLIVRTRDRDELFREACRIAVEAGKLRFVWIGAVDHQAMEITPVAWAGDEQDFLASVRGSLSLHETHSQTRSLVAEAVVSKAPLISNDTALDPRIRFKEEHAKWGIRSMAAFPLRAADRPAGVLALHASEQGFFDADEVRLLSELAEDISFALEHIDKVERLEYLANYDPLTGLANRTLLLEHLAQFLWAAQREQHRLALFILNIERFKSVNDAYGRHAGDALLKQLAERILRSRGEPTGLAHLGGDDFAVVLPRVRSDDQLAHWLESRLRELFEPPFIVAGAELRISVKLGIALFPNDAKDPETLLKNAESALKKAKQIGERYVFYAPQLNERVAEKLALENQMRRALEREEFVLYYQPKVTLDRGELVGVEALIRWRSPELGLVPPARFIPLLEETGLILPVGNWALARASRDHRGWVERKLKAPRVAVNLSPLQLRQRDFVSVIEQAIVDGVAPTGIDLEITESLVMEDVKASIEKLNAVRKLGVRIAIDDFGTGYSSLGYLAQLPVESLKIDRSFIVNMQANANAMTLVSTIISLAHSLRLKVVAEGVETEDQAKFLRLLRCDEMQGYLFSKPVPEAELVKLLGGQCEGESNGA
jgi:diguanylate cyclase (GGDEF)-like protein/PAS domain S-box-containing protein